MRIADVFKIFGESRLKSVIPTKYMHTLPFGKQIFYTTKNRIVSGIYPDSYFLRGALIPAIMAVAAGIEVACYHFYNKRKKQLKAETSLTESKE